MITDDPGTPGDKHWEINLAWTDQEVPGSTLVGVPLLDANYGVGDRIQLNYQASWNVIRGSGLDNESEMSGSQFAVKWRFYDAGDSGLQVSMYPRYTAPIPDPDPQDEASPLLKESFLMPLEVRRDFGVVAVNVDFGHTFSPFKAGRGWMGGLCLGREIIKGWEVDAEVHVDTSESLGRSETILNFGSRYDFNEHSTLLLAIGRDTGNTLGPRVTLLTYVGIQVRL